MMRRECGGLVRKKQTKTKQQERQQWRGWRRKWIEMEWKWKAFVFTVMDHTNHWSPNRFFFSFYINTENNRMRRGEKKHRRRKSSRGNAGDFLIKVHVLESTHATRRTDRTVFFFSNPLNDAADQSEGCSLDLHKYLMRKQHHTGGTSGPLQRSRTIDGSKKKKKKRLWIHPQRT